MPFLLTLIGLTLIVTGVQNTHRQFGQTLGNDLVGDGTHKGFMWWILAIGAIGSLGYIDSLRTISKLFLILVLVSMIIANPAFFSELNKAFTAGPIKPLTDDTAKDVNGMTKTQIAGNVKQSAEAAAKSYVFGEWGTFFNELIGTKEAK